MAVFLLLLENCLVLTLSSRFTMTVVLIATRKLPGDDCLQNAQIGCCVDYYNRTLRR
jgi:hypothetical protein